MATRVFLLCTDEKALEAITQILGEMDVAFEHFHDAAIAVRRLELQPYDAILVDCDNRENATLVFANLRESTHNRGVTTIGIIDGKAGIPTAFRLGANLVLTKPVSLEQARTTLRGALAQHKRDLDSRGAASGAAGASAGDQYRHPPEATSPSKTGVVQVPAPRSKVTSISASQSVGSKEKSPTTKLMTPATPASNLAIHEKLSSKTPQPPELSDAPDLSESQSASSGLTFGMIEDGKRKRSLTAFVMLFLAAAGFYATYNLRPDFQDMVNSNYSQASSQLLAWVGVAPANNAQPVASVNAPRPISSQPSNQNPQPSSKPQDSGNPQSSSPDSADDGFVASSSADGNDSNTKPAVENSGKPATLVQTSAVQTSRVQTSAESKQTPMSDLVSVPADVADAHVAYRVRPDYPERLRRKAVQGSVALLAIVKADGTVDSVQLVNGNSQLSALAADAVKQWRYDPYFRNHHATSFQTEVTVKFGTTR